MATQLLLNIQMCDDMTMANFSVGNNAEIISNLRLFDTLCGEQFIYLWGAAGVGKTHLLQACCHALEKQQLQAMYLPLTDGLSPDILDNAESMPLVCLDDIQAVLGNPAWEEALFHFYNRARERETRLLVSADVAPAQLAAQLPDLQSRLAWGLCFQVHELEDADKLRALQIRARQRGMDLSGEVGNYLLRHYSRDMSTLFSVLDQLDRASLEAQRRITIPFIKKIIA